MKKVTFGCFYEMYGQATVEIPDDVKDEDVIDYLRDNWDDMPLPTDGSFVNDSSELNVEDIQIEKDEHLIWSNANLDYEDVREKFERNYPDFTENERRQVMYEFARMDLDDEREALAVTVSRPILLIADIAEWSGRASVCKEFSSCKISDCLYSNTDFQTWYLDGKGDFRCDAVQEAGVNHYLYRVFNDDVSRAEIDKLKSDINTGVVDMAKIEAMTRRLGDDICKVYGWELPLKQSLDKAIAMAEKQKDIDNGTKTHTRGGLECEIG